MSAADLLAPSRSHVVLLDRGLNGGYGATRIMASVTAETTHLILNHNLLGNGGVRMLFHLLRKYTEARIVEMQLNNCEIGDEGLRAIAEYLRGNDSLERLFLNGNRFTGNEAIVTQFVDAINHSSLRQLSLSTNTLGDGFLSRLFHSLNSTSLRSIHMSMIGLTSSSVPTISSFLSSPASKYVEQLTLNANSLGYSGVREIIACAEKDNAALLGLELNANSVEGEQENETGANRWISKLSTVLLRNSVLKMNLRKSALKTLFYGRTLLQAKSPSGFTSDSSIPPFLNLPMELRLLILRHVADPDLALSDAQFTRLVDYASEWDFSLPGGSAGRIAWLANMGCVCYEGRML